MGSSDPDCCRFFTGKDPEPEKNTEPEPEPELQLFKTPQGIRV